MDFVGKPPPLFLIHYYKDSRFESMGMGFSLRSFCQNDAECLVLRAGMNVGSQVWIGGT